jgi:peptidoglycan/LPS O-acetylase OafA/YrhL
MQYVQAMKSAVGDIAPQVKTGFRADIEGLRGIAVLLVLFFHASLGFSGGYVGVDVFFVISGFLITGMLLREIETTGRVSLKIFYARRARRLLPAASLVLITTLVASIFLLPPLLIPAVGVDIASAALYVSNMVFAHHAIDYFAIGSAPSPILHFWSLSVEEQFYMFWPAALLLVTRGTRKPRRNIGIAIALIAIASFIFALWLLPRSQPWAFFSLPTRAWELAVGGLLAVAGRRMAGIPKNFAALLGWVGLGAVIFSGIFSRDATEFPGIPALLPTLGAALIILSGVNFLSTGPIRALGHGVLLFFGRISYSLYLWHWPLLVLPLAGGVGKLSVSLRIALAIASILLATVTHYLIENPFRRGRFIGVLPRRNLLMAGTLAVLIAGSSFGVEHVATAGLHNNINSIKNSGQKSAMPAPLSSSSTSIPVRPPTIDGPIPSNLSPDLANAKTDRAQSYVDGCHTEMDQPPSKDPCIYGDPTGTTTIVLFGDSHALSWFPAVDALAQTRGWRLLSLTMSACSPADIPAWNPNTNQVMKNCALWRQDALSRMAAVHPALVLVTGTRGFETIDDAGHVLAVSARENAWSLGMKRTIDQIKVFTKNIILLADTPLSAVDPPVCLSSHPTSVLACSTAVKNAINPQWLALEKSVSSSEKIGVIDPEWWICPSSPCPVLYNNFLIYQDGGHLTATFATTLAVPLDKAITAAAPEVLPSP